MSSTNQAIKSYKELYAGSLQPDKSIDIEQQSTIASKQAYLKIQQDELATEQELLTAKQDVSKTILAQPFSPANVIAAEKKVHNLEQGIEALKTLRQKYFPDHK